jgi:hypothetical protein
MHVTLEESAPSGFTGLPREWEQYILSSGITREEMDEHPKQVMEAVTYIREGGPKPMISTKKFGETVKQ